MPRNYVTVTGNVNIDGVAREKEIRLLEHLNGTTATLVGTTNSDAGTGAYSATVLKERNSYLIGIAHTQYGSQWCGSKAYALGDRVVPLVSNGRWYECTTAGTSGASAPTWPTSGTVTDGTVVWTDRGLTEAPICRGPFTQADPAADANVVHLVRYQEAVPIDEVTGAPPNQFVLPTMQTAIKKFGMMAPQFNGTSSMYRFAPVASTVFSANYTIDCWIYATAVPAGTSKVLFYWGDLASNSSRVQLDFRSDGKVDFYHEYASAPSTFPISTANLPLNQWVLVSGERFNNNQYLYVNGVLAAAATASPTNALVAGANHYTYHGTGRVSAAQQWFSGYIAETRVSNIARYGGQNFTVPTGGFTI